jgi:hypothetical protein
LRLFIHPVLAGLGVVIVKIASPESVFRGLLEFWPLDLLWDGASFPSQDSEKPSPDAEPCGSSRRLVQGANSRGAKPERNRCTLRAPRHRLDIVGFDDPDGNFVEVFPGIETADLPPEAFSASGELERVMAERAVWVNSVAVIRDGQAIFPLAPPAPNS